MRWSREFPLSQATTSNDKTSGVATLEVLSTRDEHHHSPIIAGLRLTVSRLAGLSSALQAGKSGLWNTISEVNSGDRLLPETMASTLSSRSNQWQTELAWQGQFSPSRLLDSAACGPSPWKDATSGDGILRVPFAAEFWASSAITTSLVGRPRCRE